MKITQGFTPLEVTCPEALRARASARARLLTGFTLIEILVALGIGAGLMIVGIRIMTDFTRMPSFASTALAEERASQQIIEHLVDEVRRIAPSNRGDYSIAEANANTLTVFTNVNDDALLERVRYFRDGTTLKRGVTRPTGSPFTYDPATEVASELIENVVNDGSPLFQYFDTNFSGTEAPLTAPITTNQIRFIRFILTIDANATALPPPFTIQSGVAPRTLKDNL